MQHFNILIVIAAATLFACCMAPLPTKQEFQQPPSPMMFGMKGVGIDLQQKDFLAMREAGIDIIATEWGMEEDINSSRKFLDQAYAAGLKVVMDGGFSARAWGFTGNDWENLPKGKRPVWQKEHVQYWVRALKDHPAIYAWDICNEFGENLPTGAGVENSGWPDSMITTEQIKQAKADVLEADSTRPVHARMYGWDIGNMPSHVSALLSNRVADIISLNLYSNYLDKGQLQWPTVIEDAGAYFVESIKQKAPGTRVWISLAAFEYPVMFQRPTAASLERDINNASKITNLDGMSFFCWGPVSQWDEKSNWYLPKTGSALWATIQQEIKKLKRTG